MVGRCLRLWEIYWCFVGFVVMKLEAWNQKQKRWRGFGRIFYDAETAEHVAGGETDNKQ